MNRDHRLVKQKIEMFSRFEGATEEELQFLEAVLENTSADLESIVPVLDRGLELEKVLESVWTCASKMYSRYLDERVSPPTKKIAYQTVIPVLMALPHTVSSTKELILLGFRMVSLVGERLEKDPSERFDSIGWEVQEELLGYWYRCFCQILNNPESPQHWELTRRLHVDKLEPGAFTPDEQLTVIRGMESFVYSHGVISTSSYLNLTRLLVEAGVIGEQAIRFYSMTQSFVSEGDPEEDAVLKALFLGLAYDEGPVKVWVAYNRSRGE